MLKWKSINLHQRRETWRIFGGKFESADVSYSQLISIVFFDKISATFHVSEKVITKILFYPKAC